MIEQSENYHKVRGMRAMDLMGVSSKSAFPQGRALLRDGKSDSGAI